MCACVCKYVYEYMCVSVLTLYQDLSVIKYRKAIAFSLESFADKGRFALDGELTRYDPIRCVVVPRYISIIGALP